MSGVPHKWVKVRFWGVVGFFRVEIDNNRAGGGVMGGMYPPLSPFKQCFLITIKVICIYYRCF